MVEIGQNLRDVLFMVVSFVFFYLQLTLYQEKEGEL
jgi:hypothetical protein